MYLDKMDSIPSHPLINNIVTLKSSESPTTLKIKNIIVQNHKDIEEGILLKRKQAAKKRIRLLDKIACSYNSDFGDLLSNISVSLTC